MAMIKRIFLLHVYFQLPLASSLFLFSFPPSLPPSFPLNGFSKASRVAEVRETCELRCRLRVSCFLSWGSGGWWSLIEIVPQRRKEDHTPWATDETSPMSGLPSVLTAERSWVRHLLWFCPNPETTCVCPLSCSNCYSNLKSHTSQPPTLAVWISHPNQREEEEESWEARKGPSAHSPP